MDKNSCELCDFPSNLKLQLKVVSIIIIYEKHIDRVQTRSWTFPHDRTQ